MGSTLDKLRSDLGNFGRYLRGEPVIYDARSGGWVTVDHGGGGASAAPGRLDPSRIEERLNDVIRLLESGKISQREAEETRARILREL